MDLGLKDCRAFVAGASRGLGLACAKALAAEGARVVICSRDAGELARAAAEIGAAGHAAADVSRPAEVTRVVAEAVAALGGLDCLVTNAGGPPTAPFDKAGDGDWDIAYQLNLMSAVRLIRAALPTLKASGRGRIVNLTGYPLRLSLLDAGRLPHRPDDRRRWRHQPLDLEQVTTAPQAGTGSALGIRPSCQALRPIAPQRRAGEQPFSPALELSVRFGEPIDEAARDAAEDVKRRTVAKPGKYGQEFHASAAAFVAVRIGPDAIRRGRGVAHGTHPLRLLRPRAP